MKRKIHLSVNGKPACGYRRWMSQMLTSTRNQDRVTCNRKGCKK